MTTRRILALVLALSSACASTATSPHSATSAASRKPALPPREKLPLAAREMLTTRMERHGERMVLLMESVVLLNYELAQVLAEELVTEPKLGRPAKGDKDTLNALLPPAFFSYQDQLGERAHRLVKAAQSKSHEQMMTAYVGVAETCVGCHAAYLYEDEERPSDDEPWLHAPNADPQSPKDTSQDEPG